MNIITLINEFASDGLIPSKNAAAFRRSTRKALEDERRRKRGRKLNPLYSAKSYA